MCSYLVDACMSGTPLQDALLCHLSWRKAHSSSGRFCLPEQGPSTSSRAPALEQTSLASCCDSTQFSSHAVLSGGSIIQCHCVQEYEPVWVWVMGKISCLPPFLLCRAAIQSMRLKHVLISQDRDSLQGTGRYPTHFSLVLCLSLPSPRKE